MMKTHWLIGKQSRKIENIPFKQLNGTNKMNDLSNGFISNNGKNSYRSSNMSPYLFNGLNRNVVTRTSSLGEETSSIKQAFLNQGFDNTSDSSDMDENDERQSFDLSRNSERKEQIVIDMETSLMRGIARGSMKMPRKYGKRGKNFNYLSTTPVYR